MWKLAIFFKVDKISIENYDVKNLGLIYTVICLDYLFFLIFGGVASALHFLHI